MNAQQLKNAILQEAIQGRLVPQDPTDEPASILLERIRGEKERLVKEGKLKKKDLAVNPISEDEIPFEIPDSWEWVRLNRLCVKFSTGPFGTMVHKEDYVDSVGHPLVNPTNIKNGHICSDGIKMVSNNKYEELSSYVLQCGDLVLARRGDLSKIAIVSEIEDGWLAGTGAFFMHFIGGLFLPYFTWLYSTSYCQNYLLNQSVGGTMSNLNQKLLADFAIPLPPLAEQKRIVAKIEELLPKVEEYGKAQEALDKLNAELPERLKKSVLQEAIEGRLVPQDPTDEPASVLLAKIRKEKEQLVKEGKLKKKDLIETPISEDEIPFDIPDSWEWCKLFDCIDITYGYPFDSTKFNAIGDGFPLIRIRDILPSSTKTYTTEIADNKYIVRKGDMLVGMDGNFNVSFWQSDDAYLNQRVCKVTAKMNILSQKYLYYYLPYELEEIFKTVSYVTVKHLSDKNFRTMRVPLPPLAEQYRIVDKLEQVLGEIDKLKK